MDKNIEEKFVNKFIDKNKKDRMIFELFNHKKRSDCIRKLPTIIQTKGKQLVLKKDEEIYSTLIKQEEMKPIYIISDDNEIDGTFENPKIALENALFGSFTYILLFDEAIFIKEEAGFSSPKYILFVE